MCGIMRGIAPRQQHITRLCIIDIVHVICILTQWLWAGHPHAGPPSHKGFGPDSWMLGSSPSDSHACPHSNGMLFRPEDNIARPGDGTISITIHALISAGRNPCHCMAPQSLSKLTLPPCLPAAPLSPTPPSVSQLCLLRASLTQL